MERLKQSMIDSMPIFSELADYLDRIAGVDTSAMQQLQNITGTSFSPDANGGAYSPYTASGDSPDYSYIPLTNEGSGTTQTINVHVGNERLETFVINSVDTELRVR